MTAVLSVIFVPLIAGYLASLREDATHHKQLMRASQLQ